jgi:hypothetical protein
MPVEIVLGSEPAVALVTLERLGLVVNPQDVGLQIRQLKEELIQ